MRDSVRRTARRRLLQLAAASPLAAAGLWSTPLGELLSGLAQTAGASPQIPKDDAALIAKAEDALDVFDFEAVARRTLPPAHFGYLATGTDADDTVRANREAFGRYQLRVRRLVNVATPNTSVKLFGATYDSPIVLAPVSSQRAFHPEGEIAVAKAAGAQQHLQILSTLSSTAIEAVNTARGEPVWFQLYPTNDWSVTTAIVARAEKAGCPVLVLTVDNLGNNRITQQRLMRRDDRACQACHTTTPSAGRFFVTRPIFSGIDMSRAARVSPQDWTWDSLDRLRALTRMKIVLKGIVTREDAERARARGVDGIIVSNHGGRAEDSGRGAIESVREVVEGVAGAMPVLVDSGFRRGTDIFKALALGATAVCIGRPYVWGLAAFGQPGVEAVLGMLRRELELVMRQAGTPSLARIDSTYVIDRGRW
jgi:isopentenyl diphosphate isomerase/L-lactate dehydrogenase-like FMN-dependent dehydrogenase